MLAGRFVAFSPSLLLLASATVGCVNLDKPQSLQKACPDDNAPTCIDHYLDSKADAGRDPDNRATHTPADPAPGDALAGTPDAAPGTPFLADTSDSSSDITPDSRGSQNPKGGDVPSPPEDARPDAGSTWPPEPQGSEPGPEAGPGPEPQPEPQAEPGPEPPRDGGNTSSDGSGASCANPEALTGNKDGGNTQFGTTGAFCFVTCDTVNDWDCSNFTETNRTLMVNGVATKCGAALPPRSSGGYYYFEIGPGGHSWDGIWWSGTPAASCPTPAGGFTF